MEKLGSECFVRFLPVDLLSFFLSEEVARYDKVRGRYSELKDKLERASARLEALKESFKDGPLQQLSEEIKMLEKVCTCTSSILSQCCGFQLDRLPSFVGPSGM